MGIRAGMLLPGVLLWSGCGATGGSEGLQPPGGITIETAGEAVRLDWNEVSAAVFYRIYWSTGPSIDPETDQSAVVSAPPYVISGVSGQYTFAIASGDLEGESGLSSPMSIEVELASPGRYFPAWGLVEPTNVISFDYDGSKSSSQNAANLQALLNALQPGDRVELGSGTYSSTSAFTINPVGTAQAPIWIVAKDGATPVITRPDNSQNTLNLGVGGQARYVCLRGLEITGGDIAVRINDCANVWFDECHIHDCAQNAIAANTLPTSHLYFTRNEVHSTAGAGEGFYIGGNFSNPVAHDCVIALNHVYDCGGSQGDGIEIKQGSWGNWIAENIVHDTNYPCIIAYGTDGNPPNLIERNVCWGSNDNVMQVQGEAIVRNNVLFDGLVGFQSGDHQGSTRDLVVVHNTILNTGLAANLNDWGGRPGMVFANNVAYSQFGTSLRFGNGTSGVDVVGNVVFGPVMGVFDGFVNGAGLGDFQGASWDGSSRDVTPLPMGVMDGAADPSFVAIDELDGDVRVPPYESGAVEVP